MDTITRSQSRTFVDRGRVWACNYEKASSHWVATSTDPEMRITNESWDDLQDQLREIPIVERRDAVAVAMPIAPMRIVDKFEG